MQPVLRTLSLGWGVQSWTLAAMVALGELPPIDYAIHADTTWEHQATYEHAAKWTSWLEEHGVRVITVRGKRTEVIASWANSISVMIPAFTVDRLSQSHGQIKRQCTHDWKIMPIRRFLRERLQEMGVRALPGAVESLMGISLDEFTRMRSSDVLYVVNSYPLVDARVTRPDCSTWLEGHGLPVPPKSSCVFCPYHKIASWKELKRAGGSDWETAVEVDVTIRDRRPNAQIFVHPARLPLPQAIKIPEDHGARQMSLEDLWRNDAPCDGGFCFV